MAHESEVQYFLDGIKEEEGSTEDQCRLEDARKFGPIN